MFTTRPDPQSERTLRRESPIWRLIRRALPFGRSMSFLLHLIWVGLAATWVVAVFFGLSLFSLTLRPTKLTPGASPESANSVKPRVETPWLPPSTSQLDRISALPSSPQPAGEVATDKGGLVTQPVGPNTADLNLRVEPAKPIIAHPVEEPQARATLVEPGAAPAATGDAASAPLPEDRGHAVASPPGPRTPHHASPRKRARHKPAPSHPPLRAIEDALQKFSRVLR
jgi:hypothetical protein